MEFLKLGLHKWVQDTCDLLKIQTPTTIQSKSIPYILKGRNVVGNAPTGSGKTLCYCLPILQILAEDPFSVFGLVLVPSRELSYQVLDQFQVFGNKVNANCQVLTGGFDESEQIHILNQKRPHILIGTPGRLTSIISYPGSNISDLMKNLRFLVLDEADRLLSESLEDDMFPILSVLPKSYTGRQTLLFSATLTNAIKEIANNYSVTAKEGDLKKKKPQELPMIIINENPDDSPVEKIRQMYLFLNHRVRLVYLHHILSNVHFFNIDSVDKAKFEKNSTFFEESQEDVDENVTFGVRNNKKFKKNKEQVIDQNKIIKQGIIFTATKQQCQMLTSCLEIMGYSVTGLHSLMNQRRRLASLGKFRSKTSKLLVATGVAARGLDVPDVEFVINYDFPRSFEDYIHRIGRVGRADKSGISLSFVTEHDVPYVYEFEGKMKKEMELLKLDENEVLKNMNRVTIAQQKALLLLEEIGFNEKNQEVRERKLKVLRSKNKIPSDNKKTIKSIAN
ncbi:ATP-dependent RNA helicase [Cryptosporidium ubiquitum]|uniref:ATP-dependent RNA helicase n=1 Tax=Cryptosporidium ubiquitum TaxID=857276 RepID=A0A1J4MNM0_9CRYT|nr:ATP-dependent RNA helicase [Cryptosporidium ubiquitum]OII74469.1 ATP-dependent RNA helicase [Cryptosporidium ubiquitum]